MIVVSEISLNIPNVSESFVGPSVDYISFMYGFGTRMSF